VSRRAGLDKVAESMSLPGIETRPSHPVYKCLNVHFKKLLAAVGYLRDIYPILGRAEFSSMIETQTERVHVLHEIRSDRVTQSGVFMSMLWNTCEMGLIGNGLTSGSLILHYDSAATNKAHLTKHNVSHQSHYPHLHLVTLSCTPNLKVPTTERDFRECHTPTTVNYWNWATHHPQ